MFAEKVPSVAGNQLLFLLPLPNGPSALQNITWASLRLREMLGNLEKSFWSAVKGDKTLTRRTVGKLFVKFTREK